MKRKWFVKGAVLFVFVLLVVGVCQLAVRAAKPPVKKRKVSKAITQIWKNEDASKKENEKNRENKESKENNKESKENKENRENEEMRIQIQIGTHELTALLEENTSAEAFAELLKEGPLTIEMSDYANMEKVGELPVSLPRNDTQISVGAGDLILYQGNSITIYYDTNAWKFTRLGKLENVSQKELKEILGSGSVSVTFSLIEN